MHTYYIIFNYLSHIREVDVMESHVYIMSDHCIYPLYGVYAVTMYENVYLCVSCMGSYSVYIYIYIT